MSRYFPCAVPSPRSPFATSDTCPDRDRFIRHRCAHYLALGVKTTMRNLSVAVLFALFSISSHADDLPWWEDTEEWGGACCHADELQEVQTLLDHYYHRAVLVARREDKKDKEVFGSSYAVNREKKLVSDQMRWEMNTENECGKEVNSPNVGMTAMGAVLFECRLGALFQRIPVMQRRSRP
ncbi:MAG: hypothetical protein JWR16_3420 [Nevskia sp.]|nr:hypothetical protein [Nevskia sp.]